MKKLLAALLLLATACSESREANQLTRTQLGEKWPFTVESVTVNSDGPAYTVTDPDGREYALNGTASSIKDDEGKPAYAPLEEIWMKEEIAPGVMGRKDLGAITALAEELEHGK